MQSWGDLSPTDGSAERKGELRRAWEHFTVASLV